MKILTLSYLTVNLEMFNTIAPIDGHNSYSVVISLNNGSVSIIFDEVNKRNEFSLLLTTLLKTPNPTNDVEIKEFEDLKQGINKLIRLATRIQSTGNDGVVTFSK